MGELCGSPMKNPDPKRRLSRADPIPAAPSRLEFSRGALVGKRKRRPGEPPSSSSSSPAAGAHIRGYADVPVSRDILELDDRRAGERTRVLRCRYNTRTRAAYRRKVPPASSRRIYHGLAFTETHLIVYYARTEAIYYALLKQCTYLLEASL